MQMPNRFYNGTDYRYGFQGQEKDNEIKGEGNSYTAKFWQYDPRIGKRWNIDPLNYAWQSGYATFNNSPIKFTDQLGLYGTKDEADAMRQKAIDNGLSPSESYQLEDTHEWAFSISTDEAIYLFVHVTDFSSYAPTPNIEAKENATTKDIFKSVSDLGPVNLYNSIIRSKYISDVAALEPLYDNVWKGNPTNQLGLDTRYNLKLNTRNNLIAGQGKMFEILEPLENKPLLNKAGNVTRFYQTRTSVNMLNKFSKFGSVFAVGTSAYRIATADDKIKETAKVTTGLAAGWYAMQITAGISAQVGLWASTVTSPLGGIIIGGAVSLTFGAIGTFAGEAAVEYIYDLLEE
ncbi:hypothetical protein Q763_17580 [Flavobacterium beibuense F44-8]|uniref:RHS repeat-associated core domain-containing protein n=1 Tax=Flavobacterium beibuense F44-8 TaxID=1406840 RepID=A0A0A2LFE6_9FLAO|nr:hypothetical protein [Flavobacterium beibuense]KGO78599.1 hypothetical protein Q763_17580 [Flavobacterium beibuense F44-8]